MTMLRSRRNPSNIEACRTLLISFGKAIRGELATRRISAEKAGSVRTMSQSSRSEESVPDITRIALSATAGKGGRLSGAQAIRRGSGILGGLRGPFESEVCIADAIPPPALPARTNWVLRSRAPGISARAHADSVYTQDSYRPNLPCTLIVGADWRTRNTFVAQST